jgi:hypothetical protein
MQLTYHCQLSAICPKFQRGGTAETAANLDRKISIREGQLKI